MKKLLSILLILFLLTGCSDLPAEVPTPLPSEQSQSIMNEPDIQTGITESVGETEAVCPGHVDDDANTICDLCGNTVFVLIDLYTINDLHGKIFDTDTNIGVDEMTTYFQTAQQTQENVLLLSAGDMWQGSAESNMTRGKLVTDWMNQVGFAATALGNHEFDWGQEDIRENDEFAQFPFLAINIYDRNTNQRASYCDSSVIVECDGVQVGIIGAIGDCYSSIAKERRSGVYFKTGQELTRLVMAESENLRDQGADFIIYLLHDGLGQGFPNGTTNVAGGMLSSYYDTALSNGYIDLVYEGHTHQSYVLVDEYGVYHLQCGGDNNGGFSHTLVEINSVSGEYGVITAELITQSEYKDMEDAPLIGELMTSYQNEIGYAFDQVGTISKSQPGNVMRQLVADLYYMAGIEKWGSDYDIVLGGGFISIRNPGYLAKGDVTYAQLQELFPFDNELVLCSIRGRDLIQRFFRSDNSNYFISFGSYGEELQHQVDPDAIYYIVTDTYSSTYSPNNLTEIERYGADIYARHLVADYIRNGGLS